MLLKESKYFLKNYSHQFGVHIIGDSYEITINPLPEKFKALNQIKIEFENSRETTELVLTKISTEDGALSLAQDIKNLLQLAFGYRVIFDRQEYVYDQDIKTLEKQMSDTQSFGYQIVHELDLKQLLSECLDKWTKLSLPEKDALSASINYLNQTYEDFIDDRLLKVTQAWESIARFWDITDDLDNEMQDLRDKVLNTYRLWKAEYPLKDPTGQIGSSLAGSLDQQKLIIRLENLATKYGLDIEKLKIDFKKLIILRNKVAHTARIDQSGSEVINLMESAIKGLQIVFLKYLGYTGKIIPNTVGFSGRKDISEYIKPQENGT